MDRFPLFGYILKQIIPIRLRHDEVPYDGGGFHKFGERAGFDFRELGEGLFLGNHSLLKRQPLSVYASLIQSWFYWGSLHECLLQCNTVEIEDYREQQKGPDEDCRVLITTKFLERDLVATAQRLQAADPAGPPTHIKYANDVLVSSRFLLRGPSGQN
ncbi:uncharacterized protein Z519_08591 [Cladophialophora bantiana CBS 173.52]|uniref:Uncharacterized protein n=1 Tax=Cladophialophora bantiana (strain ATCC 10958 / CBS 173.52 / CDC B-1940 / NIH 8579) TaxID=1442370 RepID=A0A0D2HBZ1_CLAB1|nr:uncharacterized protein Z519_08591 [Cladophialophora bantiana CBS 173.52]KIW90808.1 hypothetical protein Z519_08591 [Cladophialophora bantiana CBS 173.52]